MFIRQRPILTANPMRDHAPKMKEQTTRKLSLSAQSYVKLSLSALSAIILFHAASTVLDPNEASKIGKFFSVRNELNLPTFLSAINLIFGGGLAAIIFSLKAKRERRFWACVTLILLLMGYDEAAGVHEYYGSNYGPEFINNFFDFKATWLNSYLPAVAAIGGYLTYEISRIEAHYKSKVILPALLFISGAIGFELINFELGLNGGNWQVLVETIEEIIEIVAVIWLNHSLINIIAEEKIPIDICR